MPNRDIQVELPGGINTSLTPEEMDLVDALQGEDREIYIRQLTEQAQHREERMPLYMQAIVQQAEGREFNIQHWNEAVHWELADGPVLQEPLRAAGGMGIIDDIVADFGPAQPRPQLVPEEDLNEGFDFDDIEEDLARMEAEMLDEEAIPRPAVPEPGIQFIQPHQEAQFVQIDLGDGQVIQVQPGRFGAPQPVDEAPEDRIAREARQAREMQDMIEAQQRMDEERARIARIRVILDLPNGHVIEREHLGGNEWRYTERTRPGGAGVTHYNLEQVRALAAAQNINIDTVFRQKDIERERADLEQHLKGLRRGFVIQNDMPEEKPVRAKKAPAKKAVKKDIDGFEYGGHIWPRKLTVNEQEFVDRRGWQSLIKVIPELGGEVKEPELNADEEAIVSIAELADFYAMADMAGIPGFAMDTHENEYNQSLKKHIQTISSFKRIKHG